MADEVIVKKGSQGIIGDGTTAVNPSDVNIYRQTPKYGDPQAPSGGKTASTNKMARFYFSKDLVDQIALTFSQSGASSGANVSANDVVLKKLAGGGYIEFFLQSADEVFEERFQIVETLGDNYAVFGIGRKPRIFSFSGGLFNSLENDWRINFIYMFEQFISISRLARFRATTVKNIVNLRYDTVFLQGAILNLRTNLQASNELAVAFSFTMLVTKFDFVDITKLASYSALPETNNASAVGTTETTSGQFATKVDDQMLVLSAPAFKRGKPA